MFETLILCFFVSSFFISLFSLFIFTTHFLTSRTFARLKKHFLSIDFLVTNKFPVCLFSFLLAFGVCGILTFGLFSLFFCGDTSLMLSFSNFTIGVFAWTILLIFSSMISWSGNRKQLLTIKIEPLHQSQLILDLQSKSNSDRCWKGQYHIEIF